MTKSKININDSSAWESIEWDEPVVPDALKRTDKNVNRKRINTLRNQSTDMKKIVVENNKKRKGDLNPNKGRTGEKHPNFGRKHSDESKKLMGHNGSSNGMFGVRLVGDQNHMFGKSHTTETTKKLSEKALTREQNCHCIHCDGNFTAQIYSQYHGDFCQLNPNRIIKVRKKMKKEICPHCGKEAAPKAFARLHGNNCKHGPK